MATDDRAKAYRHFKKADPAFHAVAARHRPHLPSRLAEKRGRDALFAALASSITGQQLSNAAADTIWSRVLKAVSGKVTPASIKKAAPARLRSAGLSGAKTKTLKELAKAVLSGSLDLPSLRKLSEEEAAQKLTAIWGIGPWTAEMFLLFALGKTDVFSPGDLILARAVEAHFKLPKGTKREKIIELTKRWSPYRSYASLILWRMKDVKE